MRYHRIRELVTDKKLEVRKVNIEVNIINNLMKTLPNHRFRALRRLIGLQQPEGIENAESKEVPKELRTKRPKRSQSSKEPKG